MLLTYADVAKLFPSVRGIQDHTLVFHTVAASSSLIQSKGIYIPLEEGTGELKEALNNGAIAAIWKEGEMIPTYTPNHFPLFITNDLMKGIKNMMELYMNKLNGLQTEQIEMTKFLFADENLLKSSEATYDIAVMAENLHKISEQFGQERRG